MNQNRFSREAIEDELLELLESDTSYRGNTVEEKLRKIHESLTIESLLQRKKEALIEPSIFKQLFINDFFSLGDYSFYLNRRNISNYRRLSEEIDSYASEKEVFVTALRAAMKNAQSKISYLNSFNNEYSWITSTEFLDLVILDLEDENSLHINVNAQEATLPQSNVEEITIKEIIIHDESNCIIGDPDGGNNKTYNLLEESENKIFSAYKFNDINMQLNLMIRLLKNEIINHLYISSSNSSKTPIENIEDIIFINNSGEYISIKSISKNELLFKENKKLELYFLPVEARNIIIKFKQTTPYFLNEIPTYQVDINFIKLNRVSYKDSGVLSSKNINFGNYLSVKRNISMFPEEDGSILETKVILDNEKHVTLKDNITPEALSDYSNQLKWRINLERSINNETLIVEDNFFYNYEMLIRPFNPRLPYSEEINQYFNKNKIKVCHVLSGSLKDSSRLVSVDLGFKRDSFNNEDIEIVISKDGDRSNRTQIPVDGILANPDKQKIKIDHCVIIPIITKEYDYYYFEMGEFFELNSVKVFKDNIELSTPYEIFLSGDSIGGIAISRNDIEFQTETIQLERLSNPNPSRNIYTFNKSYAVKGTVRLLDNLGEGFVEVDYIDGAQEFKALSSLKEEMLNSQNVSSSNLIMYEPDEIVSEEGNVYLAKDGIFYKNIIFNDNVDVNNLPDDTPTIETSTNIFYLKTTESIFFTGYSINYQYIDPVASAESYFSIDYKGSKIAFSKAVDTSKRISYEYIEDLKVKFTLAKYFDFETINNTVSIFDEEAVKSLNLNTLRVYLGKPKQSLSMVEKEKYFSPIISSFKVTAV